MKTKPNPSISESEKEMLKDLFSRIFKMEPNDRITLREFKQHLGK